jgi:hypothetical protein
MSKMKVLIGLLMAACCLSATTLSVNMTVDDAFNTYISTSDAVLGTLIGSGTSWPTTETFSSLLTPAVTNYIHVVAVDNAPPAMFIGDFSLSGAGFMFANGTQLLVTNTANWGVSSTGFGGAYSSPLDLGAQGTSPWGTFAGINSGAHFIWSETPPCGSCTRYFSSAITPTAAAGVPEPSTFALFITGLALVVLRQTGRLSRP